MFPVVGVHTLLNMLQLTANFAPRLFGKSSQIVSAGTQPSNLFHRILIICTKLYNYASTCIFDLDLIPWDGRSSLFSLSDVLHELEILMPLSCNAESRLRKIDCTR
jgi:hypothetical protein